MNKYIDRKCESATWRVLEGRQGGRNRANKVNIYREAASESVRDSERKLIRTCPLWSMAFTTENESEKE